MILSVFSGITLIMFLWGIFLFLGGSGFFLMWISLEFVTWSLLPLMMLKKSITTVESIMKYFIIQSMASLTWFLGSMFWSEQFFLGGSCNPFANISILLCSVSLLLKMGIFPFHGWVLELIVSSDITVIAFLLVLQKILPLLILLNMLLLGGGSLFMKIGVIIPIFLFCFHSLSNFNKIYSLFFISSMYHVGLIFLLMSWGGSEKLAMWYFFIYSLFFFICAWACSSSQYENKVQNFAYGKSSLFFIFMGMSGLPPFLMFSLKMLLLMSIGWGDVILYGLLIIMTFYIFSFLSVFLESVGGSGVMISSLLNSNSHYSINLLIFGSMVITPLLILSL